MFKAGDIVKVRRRALHRSAEYYPENTANVERAGYIYKLDEIHEADKHCWLATSIATGENEVFWYEHEIELVARQENERSNDQAQPQG